VSVPLAVIEDIIDASGIAPVIEDMLPAGVRGRQLSARTLLIGMHLTLADDRPAHLTRVLQALITLPGADQRRLGVITAWQDGPHQLTYRQVEHTFGLVRNALGKTEPDGTPSRQLQQACDALLEASIPHWVRQASSSLAADWTDVEAWARPVPHHAAGTGADPEAAWGHRNVNLKIARGEMFFGYYYSAVTMVKDEHGPAVPELTRRITLTSCARDPAAALASVLTSMPAAGVALGDVLADSGYSHRIPATWASPLRAAGAQLVLDLHPSDRGPHGTHDGAIIANGCLYCPCTPPALLQLVPLPPGARLADTAVHDQQTAELARYKLGLHAADDADGYRRHVCPAAARKLRCPLRPESMLLDRDRPQILAPPGHPPACCTQQTITAGPGVAAKTRQKHDYPSAEWRQSYRRRTAAERLNATIKDTATTSISRGWTRLMGLTPLMLSLACLTAVRNQRILTAWDKRQQHDVRRLAPSQPPKTRSRRRREPAGTAPAPP
jgi:hypothetical protein